MEIYELAGNQTYSIRRKQKNLLHPKTTLPYFNCSTLVLRMKILSQCLTLFTKGVVAV